MQVVVKKLTDESLLHKACEATMRGKVSKISLDKIYTAEHSPIRTQLFWVEMYDIPTFVSTHFVRHHVGVTHFVTSNRDDRGGDTKTDRWTPVKHFMLINAQALINMSLERMCMKAHFETRRLMFMIKEQVNNVDPDLANHMMPICEYRGGFCPQPKSCGMY